MLSARNIFFTESALKFECHAHSIWEGYGEGVTGSSWSTQLDHVTHKTWMDLVEEYTRRDITRASDRLPAMTATMRRIAKARGWSPLWGMWANAPVDSLGWQAKRWEGPGFPHLCSVRPGFYAPSWSWASLEGAVSYTEVRDTDTAEYDHDPVVADLEVQKWDAASGVITVSGCVAVRTLTCEVTERPWGEDGGERMPPGSKGFHYIYEMGGLLLRDKKGGAMSIRADAALQPWTGVIGGEHLSTVVRVPHGEPWPEASWAGDATCLLVQRQALRCLVLILGRSRRVPGAWERIAIASGADPGLFAGAARVVLDIA